MKNTKKRTATKKAVSTLTKTAKKPRAKKSAVRTQSKRAGAAKKAVPESVTDSLPVGVVVINSRCQIVSINPAALEVFDLNRDGIVTSETGAKPSNFIELLPENEQPRWQYMVNIVMSTRDDFIDNRFFHHTGYVEKVLAVKISPLPNPDMGDACLALVVEDITDNVLMEKYLILSEKLVAKGEMATSIAHELNAHLDEAANSAEMLSDHLEQNKTDKAEENRETIVSSISKIRHFVDNLIDFSKPHTEYINYDIKHLIEDLLFSLRIQPRFKQTHFTIDLGREIPNLEIDVGQIQQVLMNILNNAADAIEEKAIEFQQEGCELKREIEIQASYDDTSESVLVDISDNGVGMTEETLGQIFEKHFSTKKSGHGLGLFNCRKIVEQHHGELAAQSVYGEGATFTIFLPRWQPRHES